jgi:SAM-dependent methyltransferase
MRPKKPDDVRGLTDARAWVDHPDLVDYYASHRNRPEELYPSERRFLPWLAAQARSVLDVGCGAGGFSEIWRSYGPTLSYTGIDISEPLVKAARKSYPEQEFIQADCVEGLPLKGGFADVVAALGWLHWERRYARALSELWRVAARYLFFDLRLLDRPAPSETGKQRLALIGDWDGHTTIPYICSSWPEIARSLLELRPARILAHGYWGKPAGTVMGVDGEVCFATFVLERPRQQVRLRPEVALELPLSWPGDLRSAVTLVGPDRVAQVMPRPGGTAG